MSIKQLYEPIARLECKRLFSVGPRPSSLSVIDEAAQNALNTLTTWLKRQVGEGARITVYPHRILKQESWALALTASEGEYNLYLLLDVTGRFLLPIYEEGQRPVRLTLEVTDNIDAYWLIEYLIKQLHLVFDYKPELSTFFGDKTVHNPQEEQDE